MESYASFISSRGLMRSCDVYTPNPRSSSTRLEIDLRSSKGQHRSVYVCSDALERFALEYAPGIEFPYTLVAGDSDREVSEALCASPYINSIIESDWLVRWFAQNLTCNHPKLFHLPIGLDYHTVHEQPFHWGLKALSPVAQEFSLLEILQRSSPIRERYFAAYCNWHFSLDRGDRGECLKKLNKEVCYFEEHRVPRSATWHRQSEFMFVISPFGAGLDCHRTWEALVLGLIPIVLRSPLSKLFDDLPVLQVDDWSEITKDLLLQTFNDFSTKAFNFATLFLASWARQFRNTEPEHSPFMTMQAFRNSLKMSYA